MAIKTFGQIDGVVVNHGVLTPIQRIADSNINDWKTVYDANFFSALALVSEGLPAGEESIGQVLTVK